MTARTRSTIPYLILMLLALALAVALVSAAAATAAPNGGVADRRAQAEAARVEMARLGEELTPAIERYNRAVAELEQALPYLRWCRERALPSGVLAEQFDPLTGDPMSVSPLTWSHAVVLSTWIEYAERHRALTRARRAEQARTSEDRDRVE